jgi:hypothetical protein
MLSCASQEMLSSCWEFEGNSTMQVPQKKQKPLVVKHLHLNFETTIREKKLYYIDTEFFE